MSTDPGVGTGSRRRFLAVCSAMGLGGTLFPGVVLGMAGQAGATGGEGAAATPEHASRVAITDAMIEAAAAIAGVTFTPEQRAMMLDGVREKRDSVFVLRSMPLQNAVAPAVVFDPMPAGMKPAKTVAGPMRMSAAAKTLGVGAGASEEERLAFQTVRELAELLRLRKVTSVALTTMYLGRLKRYAPRLHFLITPTDERAMERATAADRRLAAGAGLGPLDGVPWGAKDLLAVRGYPTTWGAAGFEAQRFEYDAEVVSRLDRAGAVLVAKLSMGALAQGDLWFGGRTRTPWNPRQGSSGSSAGSASAVSAGCVGFAIGTETLGSISSPSTRCGVTGLRPSFGRVPRTGAMALSWSMDKIGPICRCVEDCALVFAAIEGPDGRDLAVRDLATEGAGFRWDAGADWKGLRVGYLASTFAAPSEPGAVAETATDAARAEYRRKREEFERAQYDVRYGTAALAAIKGMGVTLRPMELPQGFHFGDVSALLGVEAAAAFDELTLTGRDALLTGQKSSDWPNSFRVSRMISGVDYVQMQRARTLGNAAMARMFDEVDVIVTATGGAQLTATNLSGQPAVIVPNGVRGADAPRPATDEDGAAANVGGPGTPVSLTFLGALYAEAKLLAFARAYQEATGFHRVRPGGFA